MSFSSDADIALLTDCFRTCNLPKEAWTHAAHWAAALMLLSEDKPGAYRDMPDMIRAYNESVGGRNTDTEGYHETITIASLHAAAHALETSPDDTPLHEVLAILLAGPCGRPDWLLTYWSKACLFSVRARQEWVAPDLQTLPF